MKMFRKLKRIVPRIFLVFLVLALTGLLNPGASSPHEQGVVKLPQYVQAFPDPVDIIQPDGTDLTIMKYGDEVINYTRTTDGYTLLPDEAGVYYYAMLDDNGDLVISSYKAKKPGKRTKDEEKFLKKIQKFLEYSEKQKKEKKDKWKSDKSKTKDLASAQFGPIDDAFPSTGNRNMLVILSNFSDRSFVLSNSNFNSIMNVGGSSFKAFYQDNSYSALNVTTTVVGPYNINMTMQAADNNTRDYIARCVDAANNDGVDFSQFDNDNDGTMDALYVIHAGYGEEAGAPSYTIWSHSWDLGSYARTYDGVYIFSYATSPELRGASGSTITSIGVICHEFGHNLGVPDYYDTDGSGSGGSAWDLGKWDVMAGGSWNNSGDTPAQHCMYSKWKLGWTTPTVISSSASLTLRNTQDYSESYRVNTTTSNEFFILENRQQTGWDAYLPGHGMLIFHIDGNFVDGLGSNTVNANPSHQGVDVEEADNVRSSATYSADPFPGTNNETSFTDSTTPNSKSWAGANTNKPVTNISEASGVISFDFMSGGTSQDPYEPNDNSSQAYGPIDSGTNYPNGDISSSSDEDWFHFTIQDTGTITVSVNHESGEDLDWYLYKSTDTSNYVARGYTVNNPETGSYEADWIGKYYVRVVGYNGSTSTFTLSVTYPDTPGGGGGWSGYYKLINRYSGYALDINPGSSYVYHYIDNGSTEKHWEIIDLGNGYYRLKNRNNGNDLDTGSGNYAYNYVWNGNTDKQWQIIDLGNGYYRLDNRANGYSLDVGSGNYVYVYTWNGNTDKQWQIVQVPAGVNGVEKED
jgi:M6 family metalloprotease-like protein